MTAERDAVVALVNELLASLTQHREAAEAVKAAEHRLDLADARCRKARQEPGRFGLTVMKLERVVVIDGLAWRIHTTGSDMRSALVALDPVEVVL